MSNSAMTRINRCVLACTAALTFVACESEMNFNPTQPTFPNFSNLGEMRDLEIVGTLEAEGGSALEATILYDTFEIAGARSACANARGCSRLELFATVRTLPGPHTISFQVLNQSMEAIDYRAQGTVRVRRDGLGWVATLPLDQKRVTLRSGERVDYDIEFTN